MLWHLRANWLTCEMFWIIERCSWVYIVFFNAIECVLIMNAKVWILERRPTDFSGRKWLQCSQQACGKEHCWLCPKGRWTWLFLGHFGRYVDLFWNIMILFMTLLACFMESTWNHLRLNACIWWFRQTAKFTLLWSSLLSRGASKCRLW